MYLEASKQKVIVISSSTWGLIGIEIKFYIGLKEVEIMSKFSCQPTWAAGQTKFC